MTGISEAYFKLLPAQTVSMSPRELFAVVGDEVATRWHRLLADAEGFMSERQGQKTLIVVCAQHPLRNGVEPGDEFTLRLQKALEVRSELLQKGEPMPVIYIPGSIHRPDKLNLAAAGTKWLAEHNVFENVCGEDVNEFYKGTYSASVHKGVYGCCDEAYVASCLVRDDKEIGKVTLIASHNQSLRMQLHLIANGIVPSEVLAVKPVSSYHTPPTEVQENLPSVLLARDPTFQAATESVPQLLRKLRVPGLSF